MNDSLETNVNNYEYENIIDTPEVFDYFLNPFDILKYNQVDITNKPYLSNIINLLYDIIDILMVYTDEGNQLSTIDFIDNTGDINMDTIKSFEKFSFDILSIYQKVFINSENKLKDLDKTGEFDEDLSYYYDKINNIKNMIFNSSILLNELEDENIPKEIKEIFISCIVNIILNIKKREEAIITDEEDDIEDYIEEEDDNDDETLLEDIEDVEEPVNKEEDLEDEVDDTEDDVNITDILNNKFNKNMISREYYDKAIDYLKYLKNEFDNISYNENGIIATINRNEYRNTLIKYLSNIIKFLIYHLDEFVDIVFDEESDRKFLKFETADDLVEFILVTFEAIFNKILNNDFYFKTELNHINNMFILYDTGKKKSDKIFNKIENLEINVDNLLDPSDIVDTIFKLAYLIASKEKNAKKVVSYIKSYNYNDSIYNKRLILELGESLNLSKISTLFNIYITSFKDFSTATDFMVGLNAIRFLSLHTGNKNSIKILNKIIKTL